MSRFKDEPANEMLLRLIPTEYAIEIADVISGFAHLEYAIDVLIWELAGLYDSPDVGPCLTAQLPTVNARMNALIALAQVRKISSSHISKLNKFRERANSLADKRNRVAHDPWYSAYGIRGGLKPLDKMYRLQRTAKGSLQHDYKPIELAELKKLKDDIDEAIGQLDKMGSELLNAYWSTPHQP